jgi:hypothetical protein
MTARHQAHRVCVIIRAYPESSFWIMACAMLAAGLERNLWVLIPLLVIQFVTVLHVVRRMWAPPIVISVHHRDGQVVLPTQPKAPETERRRHARH